MAGPRKKKVKKEVEKREEETTEYGSDNDEKKKSSSSTPMVADGLLPSYLAEAFADLYGEDGLLVMGKGLGWLSLLAVFVRFYADTEEGYVSLLEPGSVTATKKIKPPLVIVLGMKAHEQKALITILESWGTPPEMLPNMITNESGQNKDRAVMYKKGGVFCITSRILIVDLLSNIADAKDIDGLLVTHADQVSDQSTEAFILRIFHSQKLAASNTITSETSAGKNGDSNNPQNQQINTGFVKAFTDSPDGFVGFAKVDKVLKHLRVRRLYLYPRFHHSIREELESAPPHVDELHQELSPLMKEIQNAVAAAVQGCIRELKSATTLLQWDSPELSIENCVTSHFDLQIKKQLEHDWYRLKPQTKQLVQDLKNLRMLFQYLIQYDCVSFWKLINSMKTSSAASRNPSLWLLMPAADMMFRKAKERIYKVVQTKPSAKVPKPVAKLKPVLEETPKWKLLKQVLGEIQQEENKKRKNENGDTGRNGFPVNVLVMVKDERSLEAIRAYLVDGKSRTMMRRWLRYLELVNDRSRSLSDSKGGSSALSEESRLLLEEEGRVRRLLFSRNNSSKKPKTAAKGGNKQHNVSPDQGSKRRKNLNEVPDYTRKRRKIASERGRGGLTTSNAEDLERNAVLDEAVERIEHEMDEGVGEGNDGDNDSTDALDNGDRMMFEVKSGQAEMRVILKSYSSVDGDEAMILLHDLMPAYVVLVDSEISFIRALEVYSALSKIPKDPLRVYFLIFEASAEEKTFMNALEREQKAFEKLIEHKKRMPPPAFQNLETQEMQQAQALGIVGGSYMGGSLPLAFDTRQGRGKAKKSTEMRDIAVDVREFRSALPSILHQGGMRLAPVTLTVGDFVLSSVHCVERKSISDLFQSLNSGRLDEQATSMAKHYKCPCLLIEFDPNKSFSLQNSNELGVDIRKESTCSKMVVLTMHHPKLRLLWSRSPHDTLDIFKDLKQNHEEVDVEKAMEVGRNESLESLCEDDSNGEDEINEVALNMLRRLPGVNSVVARRIVQNCDSLAELFQMDRDELRKVAGPATGQKLFKFFQQTL